RRVPSAGSVTLRRSSDLAGALEGCGPRARGASGHGRGERRAGPDRGDAVAGARRDPGRIGGRAGRSLHSGRQGRDHSQPFVSHRTALRRVSRGTGDGGRGRGTRGGPVENRAGAMSAPPPAVAALVWAVAGPPILIYGA